MEILKRILDIWHVICHEPEVAANVDATPNTEFEKGGDKDADTINKNVGNHSRNARTMGRYTAFSLLGLGWTVSYQYSQFHPSGIVKISFLFSILYLLFDYLYFIFITLANKWVLGKCFESIKGNGYRLKIDENGEKLDPYPYSKLFSKVGTIQILVNAALLITSALLLIIHILSISYK